MTRRLYTCIPRTWIGLHPNTLRRPQWGLLCGLLAALGSLTLPVRSDEPSDEVRLLALTKGQSALMHYPNLERLAVGDSEVADVAVVSKHEFLLYAKGVGETDLHIWDDRGIHWFRVAVKAQPAADALIERLQPLLGTECRVVRLSDAMIAVEGTAKSQTEAERLSKLLEGVDNGVKVINLITLDAPRPPEPPISEILEILGPGFTVRSVGPSTIAVEGSPKTAAEAERARALLSALDGQVKVVDLIQEPPPVGPTIDEERDLLADALGDSVSIRVVGRSALVVEGLLPWGSDAERVAQTLETLQLHTPVLNQTRLALPDKQQVLVRVKVVEVSQDDLKRIGVNWGNLQDGNRLARGGAFSFLDQPFLFGQFGGGGIDAADFSAQIDLLAQDNRARILAQPNVLVNDGEEATILVGGEVPIPVPQAGGTGAAAITVEYKDFGVSLKVKPTVLEGAGGQPEINLALSPEVSSIDPASSVTISGISIPGFRTRRAETNVDVTPGSTLVIGGLIQRDVARITRKIPFLGDIPVLGHLFRSKEFSEGKTDLVIMVTPEIQAPTR
jgi:Flp pilus assembly secretin CpaC